MVTKKKWANGIPTLYRLTSNTHTQAQGEDGWLDGWTDGCSSSCVAAAAVHTRSNKRQMENTFVFCGWHRDFSVMGSAAGRQRTC
eukprot:gene8998-1329_t